MKPEEVKRGYWFLDTILQKPIQVKTDGQDEFVSLRRYQPLPITHDMLTRVGFKLTPGRINHVYEKNKFCVYFVKATGTYHLKQFEELMEELKFMHQLQKRYREEVE